MNFLERAIKNGISNGINKGVSNAISNVVGNAVKQVIEPKATAYANKVADELDQSTQALAESSAALQQETQQAAGQTQQAADAMGGFGGAFANLQRSMESYATMAAQNTKICPRCQNPTTADRKFCPTCGAQLPEETLAAGTVCPSCGMQNTIGTRFCAGCGTKLPFAAAEEKAAAEKDAAVLKTWAEKMPGYPVWDQGGSDFELDLQDDYAHFSVTMASDAVAHKAVENYRELLMQNGFRQAGEYPSILHLYKKVNGVCYHVDTEHCFEGDLNAPWLGFDNMEPMGGFDYVKPASKPQTGFGLKDLFKF